MEDPIATLLAWRDEARAAGEPEPDAMALGTATPDGVPAVRIVLFRGMRQGRICFFTNYGSRKGDELDANPRAALCFYWPRLGRQVRIEGRVVRTTNAESDEYFAGRPRGHQLSAWASDQSQPIQELAELEARYAQFERAFDGKPVPRPEHWGGYALDAERIELWIGRDNRLHERRVFERRDGRWQLQRLAP